MAHCPNCSPQPRNEHHTTDRLQKTVKPLLYTRNFMLAKYFKMECECMRCQEFISSTPKNGKATGKILEHLRSHANSISFSPCPYSFISYCPYNVCECECVWVHLYSTIVQNWPGQTSSQILSRTYILSDFQACNFPINLEFCLFLDHIKSC